MNEFLKNEMGFEYLISIPKSKVLSIPGAEVYSIYIVRQQTIDKEGWESIKYWPCHDLSFLPKGLPNMLVNTRHIKDEMFTIQYTFTM